MSLTITFECKNLSKSFGNLVVLNRINFEIKESSITLLKGENGVGKTTLCKIFSLLMKQDEGKLFFNGTEITLNNKNKYKESLGFLSHQSMLYKHLTGYENLLFFSRLYNIKNKTEKINDIIEKLELKGYEHKKVLIYSKGIEQRFAIARALIHEPKFLILDEPFANLDFKSYNTVFDLILKLKDKGASVLIVSHRSDIIEKSFIDKILTLKDGKLIEDE